MTPLTKAECLALLQPHIEAARKTAERERKIALGLTLNRHIPDQHAPAERRRDSAARLVRLLESVQIHLEAA